MCSRGLRSRHNCFFRRFPHVAVLLMNSNTVTQLPRRPGGVGAPASSIHGLPKPHNGVLGRHLVVTGQKTACQAVEYSSEEAGWQDTRPAPAEKHFMNCSTRTFGGLSHASRGTNMTSGITQSSSECRQTHFRVHRPGFIGFFSKREKLIKQL